ncbi:MAG: LemA family protein [Candidatus Altiarchaeota archaeon]|nr:LemA family protein [Candidatus Altiarchaeota archaeon]
MDSLLLILGILVFIAIVFVVIYNGLVTLRARVRNAWAQIDVQLKRRYDLIPNLVETVKGYAKHEREVFENVTKARAAAINASGVEAQAQAENMLSGALKSLFAVAENYPDLKASQNFMMLQEELSGTENKIAYSRQFYNDSVMEYNIRIQKIPYNVIAGMFGFHKEQLFEVKLETEREAPKVRF